MADKQLISVGPSPFRTPQRIAAPSSTGTVALGYNQESDDWLYYDPQGSPSLTVKEDDGSPSVANVDTLSFASNFQVTDDGSGDVSIDVYFPASSTLALDDLSDAAISSASNSQVLQYNGTNFVNVAFLSMVADFHMVGSVVTSEGITDPPELVWSEDGTEFIHSEPGQ